MKLQKYWRVSGGGFLFLCGFSWFPAFASDDIVFNTDVLDVEDRDNFDLTPFTQTGYIMPGDYLLTIKINGQNLASQTVSYRLVGESSLPEAKLDKDLVELFGLKDEYQKKLIWTEDGGLDYSSLPGMTTKTELANSTLNITVPQIYLEYISADWDPPARWDEGVAGALLDYSLNASTTRSKESGKQHYLTGSGTLGANAGPWRLRADWQMQNMLAKNPAAQKGVDISRYYLYRALPKIRATLTAGENYLSSFVFDSFRFMGTSIESDVSMLPPSLRGYAPEVNGVAESNATVVISQQDRILYQTQVPPGPFSIQDLSSSVSGQLDVEIREEGGHIRRYQVATASLPYLTRPGSVRYQLSGGRPAGWDHQVEGPMFVAGEASWGVSNGWSLYGGTIGSDSYQSYALGLGRDLFALGAISADVTVSRQRLPGKETEQGRSLRINYAKMFEELDSQVTFAGYRFSQENFYSMGEYLGALKGDIYFRGNSKERYDLSFNKRFAQSGVTAYLNYSRQSYWNRPTTQRFDLSVSHYFDLAGIKNINGYVRAYRQSYYDRNDDGMSLGMSIPWGVRSRVNYDANIQRDRATHSVGYSGSYDRDINYSLRSTLSRHDEEFSGFLSHWGNAGDISLSATHSTSSRNTASVGLNGGATWTAAGIALHGSGSNGGTRLMIDTEGVADVPVQGAGRDAVTNRQGLAVMNGVGSYHRAQVNVALDKLDDNIEATNAFTQLTLTEGAIGYRRMEVVAGYKGLAVIRLDNGKAPPFGAVVYTATGKNAGIVADDGQIWLSGMKPAETMQVRWDGATQCEVALPGSLSHEETAALLLPCHRRSEAADTQPSDSGNTYES